MEPLFKLLRKNLRNGAVIYLAICRIKNILPTLFRYLKLIKDELQKHKCTITEDELWGATCLNSSTALTELG